VRTVLEAEIASVTDNPLIFVHDGEPADFLSGGNFHGQAVALAMDVLAIAVAELANISERRVEQLVNPALNSGLPPFLAPDPGLTSGFMIAQVAAASLVSENKVLCHPSSVDSIPSSANREDHVSMGAVGAAKARQVVGKVAQVLAVETICAAQALDLRRPLVPGLGVAAAHSAVRTKVPVLENDRQLSKDIVRAVELVRGGLVRAVEAVVGPLP